MEQVTVRAQTEDLVGCGVVGISAEVKERRMDFCALKYHVLSVLF